MIRVSAKQTKLNIGGQAGKERFVLMAQIYNTLSEAKVIAEAALRTGLPKSVVRACWEGCGEVISAWCVEGHSCPVPGLGHMRFGIRATSVEKVEDVSSGLITSRRVIFIPSVAIKEELAKTNISITCYDRDGKKIKTVTSVDTDDIEEDDGSTTPTGDSGNTSNTGDNAGNESPSDGNSTTDGDSSNETPSGDGNGGGTSSGGGTGNDSPSGGGDDNGGDTPPDDGGTTED